MFGKILSLENFTPFHETENEVFWEKKNIFNFHLVTRLISIQGQGYDPMSLTIQ